MHKHRNKEPYWEPAPTWRPSAPVQNVHLSPNEYGLEKRNTNQNHYGLSPLVVYMRKKQDTMANEMDTNRIMWTDEGKRTPDLTCMNQQELMDVATAKAVNETIIDIVNESELNLQGIRAIPLTMSGSRHVKFIWLRESKPLS